MTFIIGSTRYEGLFLAAHRVRASQIVDANWTDARSLAAEFSEVERETLKLPLGGCWIVAGGMALTDFDLSSFAGGGTVFTPQVGGIWAITESVTIDGVTTTRTRYETRPFETDHEQDEVTP